MIAYKLFKVRKDGTIGSLFINKKAKLPLNEWLECGDHKTKGFAHRPYWHSTSEPKAPHLSMKDRKWFKIYIYDYFEMNRPKNQGGKWFLSKYIKIIEPLD